ncbi:recombination regulator RecX [Flavonifractor sp. DFI.6.63]|uniref:regulatory protein RecX n=1 Tax=Oscillospiraceae TaxID=216572 RepID=UPI00210DC960|nr:regulatory protein RecX [Flavonifractor sp. DFI.6.63]MBS1384487.1 regulatory protein RecX [Flavonifractor sp.]MCQ5030605.1 recombination regulator RecX [Flavonifractor sp. DFI.6.63]MDU2196334.1 regulatory protein RecX [Clostridiales bacterium]
MKIVKLRPSQRVRDRWLAFLEDGAILRLGSGEVAAFGLYAGMELSPELLERLNAAARQGRVRDKALDLIAARPLSRKELTDKLTARPRDREKAAATAEEAAAAADWLEEMGYLDDADYARRVVEHYSARGCGPAKLRDELYRRGVPRDCWDDALAAQEPPEGAIDALLQKRLRGADPSDPRALKRAADALARRGYRWEEIQEGLERYRALSE